MTGTCPCCGQQLPTGASFKIEDATGVVVGNGKSTRLEPRAAQLVRVLISVQPSFLNEDELRAALGLKISVSVRTLIYKARAGLRPLDADIVAVRGHGYRLKGVFA